MNDFKILTNSDDLDDEWKLLMRKATEALEHAYAPYSNFHVASALLLDDGSVVTGTNQENASYPAGMCAERVALFAMTSLHGSKKIKKMLVVARLSGHVALAPATSCGPCRQVMLEFEQRQQTPYEVIMLNQEHQWVKAASAKSLLPFCFTNESLQVRK